MPTRCQVLHDWIRDLHQMLPGVHAARTRTLATMVLGMVWSGRVSVLAVAAALPLSARQVSSERRFRRFLANAKVEVATLWPPLLTALLAGLGGGEASFVFDPTPYRDDATLLCLGLVWRGRVLPVAWRVVPQQEAWPARLAVLLEAMLREVSAALPPGVSPTLLADRGLVGPGLIDATRRAGWHLVLRLRAGEGEATVVRIDDGPEQRLATLPTGPGQRWTGPVVLFKAAGWRRGYLTIHWAQRADEPWVLFSDRPGGPARVREYRRRATAEATYEDLKRRGFDLERSKITALDRIDRVLLVVHLALWWGIGLGLQTIRMGQRPRFDRHDRRDLSLLRLGRTACLDALAHDRAPTLPFRCTPAGWRFRWLS
jgi:Transposase DDE domain